MKDFFESRTVLLLTSIAGNMSMMFICIVEWFTLRLVLGSLTGWSKTATNGAVWFLATFVITCEFVGGMTSVATTDAIQAFILLLAVFLMPMLGVGKWGGLDALGGEGGDTCDNLREKYVSQSDFDNLSGRWSFASSSTLTCAASGSNEWGDCTAGEDYVCDPQVPRSPCVP